MTEIEYRVADLINFSSNQKPLEFETALKGILAAKVSDAVDARKIELAATVFNPQSQDQEMHDSEEEEHGENA